MVASCCPGRSMFCCGCCVVAWCSAATLWCGPSSPEPSVTPPPQPGPPSPPPAPASSFPWAPRFSSLPLWSRSDPECPAAGDPGAADVWGEPRAFVVDRHQPHSVWTAAASRNRSDAAGRPQLQGQVRRQTFTEAEKWPIVFGGRLTTAVVRILWSYTKALKTIYSGRDEPLGDRKLFFPRGG